MEPKVDQILEFPPNVVQIIRKFYYYESDDQIEEALDLLEDWVRKQEHFLKKNYDRYYLETALLTSKGSIERTKERFDRLCTLRSLMPDYFVEFNPKRDFDRRSELLCCGMLPKLDENYHRIFMVKVLNGKVTAESFKYYFQELVVLCEYMKMHDYNTGFVLVFDYTQVNVMDLVSVVNFTEIRNIITLLVKGYGMIIKGMHLLLHNTNSKLIEILWAVVRALVSEKVVKRTHFHKTLDSFYEHTTRDVLPVEYGGKEISLAEINDKWLDVLSSEQHQAFMKEINKAGVDEKSRLNFKFNEEHLGLPGSFRQMTVD